MAWCLNKLHSPALLIPLEPGRGLVLRFETIGVAVDETPFSILAAEDVRHAIAPSRHAFDAFHALVRVALDVGHEEHVVRHDGRDVLVAHAPAPELPAGPVPARGDPLPTFL